MPKVLIFLLFSFPMRKNRHVPLYPSDLIDLFVFKFTYFVILLDAIVSLLLNLLFVCCGAKLKNGEDPIVASESQQPSRWDCSLGLSCHLHTEKRQRWLTLPTLSVGFRFKSSISLSLSTLCLRNYPPRLSDLFWIPKVFHHLYCMCMLLAQSVPGSECGNLTCWICDQ